MATHKFFRPILTKRTIGYKEDCRSILTSTCNKSTIILCHHKNNHHKRSCVLFDQKESKGHNLIVLTCGTKIKTTLQGAKQYYCSGCPRPSPLRWDHSGIGGPISFAPSNLKCLTSPLLFANY